MDGQEDYESTSHKYRDGMTAIVPKGKPAKQPEELVCSNCGEHFYASSHRSKRCIDCRDYASGVWKRRLNQKKGII